ncbi:sensor histidine kinase [Nocardia sp. CA-129566]|uniref:sensor histidine kinase n=1 Tax=Nocardia sp. CA-129566 TaxID=3239976 RepID=UPI003D982613
MIRPRALTWVACFLYASVLLAGVAMAGMGVCPSDGRLLGFVGVLAALCALELAESRRTATRVTAIAGLVARAVLFALATALDCQGNAKVLFALLPLMVYFTLGRRTAFGFAALGLIALGALVLARPPLRHDPESVSDLLMFAIGVVFALAIAVIAEREQAGRRRAEVLLTELSDAHARLREYADQAASLAAVAERRRMARDIHDTVGHHLVVTAIQLEKSAAYRPLDPAIADQALTDGRDSARLALQEVRRALETVRNDPEFTLRTALTALVDRLDDPEFTVRLDLMGAEQRIREPARLALYFAAQEALTNARRHSGASAVTVRADLADSPVTLEITDNGGGFAPGSIAGHGLAGMRERLDLVGGTVEITSGPTGTRVVATVPEAMQLESVR